MVQHSGSIRGAFRNTTNRSWWIVHTRPRKAALQLLSGIPPTAVGGSFILNLIALNTAFTGERKRSILSAMFLTPYTHLTWAYQLHYHLLFRTYRRRPFFSKGKDTLEETLSFLFDLYGYHSLETKLRASDVQLLLSLKPEHRISEVLKRLKGESSKALCPQLEIEPPLWARGYLARTAGRVRVGAVKEYLNRQAEHHGYSNRALPPVFRFRTDSPTVLSVAHASFDLKHHLVLATDLRRGVFDSKLGEALVNYWIKVAGRREFALDQVTVLPDHVHLLLRITPKMSIEECTLLLMNNGQYFIGKNYPERLIETGINRLWLPSAYAGTCGELPTALLRSFLRSAD